MFRFNRPTFRSSPAHPLYRHAPNYDPAGATALVFEQQTTNPLYRVGGTGIVPRMSLRITQPPPFVFAGYRGIVGTPRISGQLYTAPLLQPLV